ncbi:MAG: TetR/AcrR family transcriptional regulator [Deltaproteobacteria bacterium]|nr:TetR/AcrR family transcriptional regulator [Deltaproteobacteria bacterium]
MKEHAETRGSEGGETTRDKLLAAARECLLRYGHEKSSVKKIAQAAGVNHGLVHHYFGSKEEMLAQVLDVEAAEIKRRALSVKQRADMVPGFVTPEWLRNTERMQLLAEFFAMARHAPLVAEKLREILPDRRKMLMQAWGMDDAMAALVQGVVFGLGVQKSVDPTTPAEAAAELLSRLLSAALKSRKE